MNESRDPEESRTTKYELVLPSHTNALGTAFGGTITSWIDIAAAIACQRHSLGQVVTASMDRIDFVAPVKLGDIVKIEALVTYTGETSMETAVTIDVENDETGEVTRAAEAFLTFVALDKEGKTRPVPPLDLTDDAVRKRFEEGEERKRRRLELVRSSKHVDIKS